MIGSRRQRVGMDGSRWELIVVGVSGWEGIEDGGDLRE